MNYKDIGSMFKDICDAIRAKDGTTALIRHKDIPARIEAISGGGNVEASFTSPFYTYAGSGLKIEDMVASGFDGNSAIYTPNCFTPFDKPWEIQIKFRLEENSAKYSRNFLLGTSSSKNNCPYIAVRNYNTDIAAGIPDKNGNIFVESVAKYEFDINTDYWVKFIRDESEYILRISTNGADYESIIQFTYDDEPYQDDKSKLALGCYNRSRALYGSIDLKQTYIKIGEEVWWGGGNHEEI